MSWLVGPDDLWGTGWSLINRRNEGDNSTDPAYSSWIHSEPKNYTHTMYHDAAAVAVGFFAVQALLFMAHLTGLILGICGLNMTLLELHAATGTPKERKQACCVVRMKRHQTWMLCSLIIVSVACGESFPFLVQSIYAGPQVWVPIIISTVCIALVGEILPQYIIPQRAVAWGYYSWPVVWGCMFLTGIVSYPLAFLLDRFAGQKDEQELFTNEELGGLVKYHEKSEKNGGTLGPDASRIMLGALKLDSCRIGGEILAVPEPESREMDPEKADFVVVQGMIVKWSAVKTININERVDEAFIKKVQGWSYSRIPVIGMTQEESKREQKDVLEWLHGAQIYGFLHVKSLINLDVKFPENPESPLLVRDLSLYPLPIVREDMSVYELLNMFQSGMSRMALVVPNDRLTCSKGAIWTVTHKTDEQTILKLGKTQENYQWSTDYLAAATAAAKVTANEKYHNTGIKSPKPIGIVTFEDIIDSILQKTSRDEKDFFDRDSLQPPTKTRKAGDFPVDMRALVSAHVEAGCTAKPVPSASNSGFERARNTLRKRRVTDDKTVCVNGAENGVSTRKSSRSTPAAMDGADENSIETRSNEIKIKKIRGDGGESSYTQNSQGGFHADVRSESIDTSNVLTAQDIADLAAVSLINYETSTMRSLPSRSRGPRSLSDELNQTFRHVSAAPKLPSLSRISPFSRDAASSSGKDSCTSKDEARLVMPEPSRVPKRVPAIDYGATFNPNTSGADIDDFMEEFVDGTRHHVPEQSGETASLHSSTGEHESVEDVACLYDSFPVPVPLARASQPQDFSQHTHHSLVPIEEETETATAKVYSGFPVELLDNENKESRVLKRISSTMPRSLGSADFDIFETPRTGSRERDERERSVHDDRALLPSQRKEMGMQDSGESVSGIRRTSLWF